MVFTHLRSNVLLILVPFMPSLPGPLALLLLRFSISQMMLARQSYTMAVVSPDERSAASGVTVARSVGQLCRPSLATWSLGTRHYWHAVHLGRWSENCVRPASLS